MTALRIVVTSPSSSTLQAERAHSSSGGSAVESSLTGFVPVLVEPSPPESSASPLDGDPGSLKHAVESPITNHLAQPPLVTPRDRSMEERDAESPRTCPHTEPRRAAAQGDAR